MEPYIHTLGASISVLKSPLNKYLFHFKNNVLNDLKLNHDLSYLFL